MNATNWIYVSSALWYGERWVYRFSSPTLQMLNEWHTLSFIKNTYVLEANVEVRIGIR